MISEPTIVTKAAFARLCNVSPGRVSQWISEGRIQPANIVGTGRNAKIRAEPARAYLNGSLDPGKMRNDATGGTNLSALPSPPPAPALAVQTFHGDDSPKPEDYRSRADLPGDFERGVLFATHCIAHSIPTMLGCSARENGLSPAEAMALYHEARRDITFIVSDPIEAVGLVPKDSDDCGPHAPAAFQGFNPNVSFS